MIILERDRVVSFVLIGYLISSVDVNPKVIHIASSQFLILKEGHLNQPPSKIRTSDKLLGLKSCTK